MDRNVLFLCLDSTRYDTFIEAETPNMNEIGPTQRAHSISCWTFPSMMSYLMNMPPIGVRERLFPDQKEHSWMPREFTLKGYRTSWLSGNGVILSFDTESGGLFRKWFQNFEGLKYIDKSHATELIIADLEKISLGEPMFISILLMDTHHPYFSGNESWSFQHTRPEENFRNQVRAIEYVDGVFPKLIEPLRDLGRPTEVIITSDHGELFGPEYFGHSPVDHLTLSHLRFDPKLFEIPFVRGEV